MRQDWKAARHGLDRRGLLRAMAGLGIAGAGLAACAQRPVPQAPVSRVPPQLWQSYGPVEGEPYPIEGLDLEEMDLSLLRQVVPYATREQPGTIVVDTPRRFLYLVMEGGRAMRYGVGVGKEGLDWGGRAIIGRKAAWPGWTPTASMIARDPRNAEWAGGMPGGPENPLGARALYLYSGGRDTLYRLHGTNEPWSIGQAVSSGCVRLLNHDIIDLHDRVPVGTPVVVRQ